MNFLLLIFLSQKTFVQGRNPLRSVGSASGVMSYASRFLSRGSTTNYRSVGPVSPVIPPVEKPTKTSRLARVAEATQSSSIAIAGVGTLLNGLSSLAGFNVSS